MSYNTQSPSAILILINKEQTYLDSNNIITQYKSPVIRWKELIGNKNPLEDKNKTTLRGKYGVDIIKNEFYGSDSPGDAYRELTNFYFSLPAKTTEFKFEIMKISESTLLRFLFPVVPKHPDVCGRLDLFAKYGPVLDYHLLDMCFCFECKRTLRNDIIDGNINNLKKDINKVLSDEFLSKRLDKLCKDCNTHVLLSSHLFSGREQTHILTKHEIDIEVDQMNRESLLTVLKSEKGSCAETILSKIDLSKPPSEIVYCVDHVKELLKHAETDYYDRYDFESLQNLIFEDRRIRINHWVGSIISKPGERFKIPQLINPLTKKEINNMKTTKYTLLRTNPIIVRNFEEEEYTRLLILHPMFIKKKLSDFEIKNMIMKLFNKNFFKVATDNTKNDTSMAANMLLMRNFELCDLKSREKENEYTMKKLKKEINKIEMVNKEKTLHSKFSKFGISVQSKSKSKINEAIMDKTGSELDSKNKFDSSRREFGNNDAKTNIENKDNKDNRENEIIMDNM